MDSNYMLDVLGRESQIIAERDRYEIMACNSFSSDYGLILTEDAVKELTTRRMESLKRHGRVEFGGGIMPKLIFAFCDSTYIRQENYVETLAELQDCFYYFKNEFGNRFSDDELIQIMEVNFNGASRGSVDHLAGTELEILCRTLKMGYNAYECIEDMDEEDEWD